MLFPFVHSCAPTGDQTHHVGVLGRRSNQLSSLTILFRMKHFALSGQSFRQLVCCCPAVPGCFCGFCFCFILVETGAHYKGSNYSPSNCNPLKCHAGPHVRPPRPRSRAGSCEGVCEALVCSGPSSCSLKPRGPHPPVAEEESKQRMGDLPKAAQLMSNRARV